MKFTSNAFRLLTLISLTASASLVGIQTANANSGKSIHQSETNLQNSMASQLGEALEIRSINSALSRPQRELPTFKVQNKSPRRKGILGVLGGRFENEDRHPSFRKSAIKR